MGRKKKVGRLTRKNRAIAKARNENEEPEHPQCFVITRGNVGKNLVRLTLDFRKVMEPNTSSSYRLKQHNNVADFLAVAGQLHVTHLVIFSQTEVGLYMKLIRIPNGPTLIFKIVKYSLSQDVMASLKRPHNLSGMYLDGPSLMTNVQPDDGPLHQQLASRMFLDLFPTITPNKAKIEAIKRCCLIHHNSADDTADGEGQFELRHYVIRVMPRGVSRAVRKLNKKKLPDLSRFRDVSEFMTRTDVGSESEGEDDPAARVTVSSKVARSRIPGSHESSVKLYELGPRMSLQLVKIEEGLLEGRTLYNRFIVKTDEEKLQMEKERKLKMQLKAKRKEQQEENVAAKKKKKEEHKKKCLEGMAKVDTKEESDDDVQYYREEVGEEPDKDLFNKDTKGKRKVKDKEEFRKKFKKGKDKDSEDNDGYDNSEKMTRKERREKKITASKEKKAGVKFKINDKKGKKMTARDEMKAKGKKLKPLGKIINKKVVKRSFGKKPKKP